MITSEPATATETFHVAREVRRACTTLPDASMTDDWVGFCTKKMLFGSNRKASSQINSSRSFRPLRPRSKTSTAASIGQIPVRPLVVSVCCLLWCFRPFGLFSRILPCWFLIRVLEGSPSLLVVLITGVILFDSKLSAALAANRG